LANNIIISFTANPAKFSRLAFTVISGSIGYEVPIDITFITGLAAPGPNHVKVQATLSETLTKLAEKLNAIYGDGNMSFEKISATEIRLLFNVVETYSYTIATVPSGTTFTNESVTVPVPDSLAALNIKDLSISIIDTYTNERILIEELAQADVCKIDWDGGDDQYQAVMASKLAFNMLVENFEDAHFLHLFSGDEQRYRVELNAIDAEENIQLIWQGFYI